MAVAPAKASMLVTMVTPHRAEASGGQEGGPHATWEMELW